MFFYQVFTSETLTNCDFENWQIDNDISAAKSGDFF